MPFNGSGVFTQIYNWITDAANGVLIRADRMQPECVDIAAGLTNCICKDGQTVITANLPMATFKHTNVGNGSALTDYAAMNQLQSNSAIYAADSGSSNAYVITPVPSITAYAAGQRFIVLAGFANTGAATINISGLGAQAIKKNVSAALEANDIKNGGIFDVTYDGTNFQLRTDVQGSNINMNNQFLEEAAIINCGETAYNLGNIGGAVAINYENGHVQYGTLTSNISGITVSNWPSSGTMGSLDLFFIQDGTGSRTLTLSSAYKPLGQIAPVLTTTAGAIDELILRTYTGGTAIFTNLNKNY